MVLSDKTVIGAKKEKEISLIPAQWNKISFLLPTFNPIKPRGAESVPPSVFLSVDFYQVHLQSRNFLTFSFYPCHDQKLIF